MRRRHCTARAAIGADQRRGRRFAAAESARTLSAANSAWSESDAVARSVSMS
jgi:hypothetical protein